jgi:hypothetical protein
MDDYYQVLFEADRIHKEIPYTPLIGMCFAIGAVVVAVSALISVW